LVLVKDEPEESKPYVSTLDLRKENTSTWLVRVPHWLAVFWASQGPDVDLGKVQIKQDHLNAKNNEAYLYLPEKYVDLPCTHFKMKTAQIVKPMKILSEDIQGNVVIEGTVKHKFDLEPLEKSKLRQAIVKYAADHDVRNKNNALARTKVIDTRTNRQPASLRNDISRKRPRDEKGVPEKRERTEKNQLVEMIFDCFREREFWTLKDLNERCKQPVAWLKEVLNQYCDYNKRGPNKQTYELKGEYAPHKKQRTEDKDDEDDNE